MQILNVFKFLLWPLTLLLTVWVLFQLPVSTITMSIAQLHWQDWCNWLLLNCLIIYFGVLRWSALINIFKASISFLHLMCIRQAGQAVSFITPGPQFGGEPLQIFWLNRSGIPLQKGLLSLVLDRFFELWINFSMLLVGVTIILFSPPGIYISSDKIICALMAVIIFIIVIPVLLINPPKWFSRFLKQLTERWQHTRLLKIYNQLQNMKADLYFAFTNERPRLVLALFLSLGGWVALIGELLLLLHFVDVHLNITEFVMLLVAMRFALLLPIPGGIGTIEASVFWSFQVLNLSSSAALALIALMRLRDAAVLLFGLGCARYSAHNARHALPRESIAKKIEG